MAESSHSEYAIMVHMDLQEEQLGELRAAVRQNVYDRSVPARAQIVLWYHEGCRKTEIVKMSGASRPTIDMWIDRYAEYGLDGLTTQTSPGGTRTIPDRIRGRVLALTRQTPPAGAWDFALDGGRRWPIISGRPKVSRFPSRGSRGYGGTTGFSRGGRAHSRSAKTRTSRRRSVTSPSLYLRSAGR